MRVSVVAAILLALVGCGADDPPTDEGTQDITGEGGAPPPVTPPSVTPPGGPSVQCAIGTAVESEDNDTAAKANAFTEDSFCGVLSTGADVDYSTFKTPAGKRLASFQAIIHGAVDFDLVVGGVTLKPSDTDKFTAGTYVVKAYTKAGTSASYQYRVDYK